VDNPDPIPDHIGAERRKIEGKRSGASKLTHDRGRTSVMKPRCEMHGTQVHVGELAKLDERRRFPGAVASRAGEMNDESAAVEVAHQVAVDGRVRAVSAL